MEAQDLYSKPIYGSISKGQRSASDSKYKQTFFASEVVEQMLPKILAHKPPAAIQRKEKFGSEYICQVSTKHQHN